MDIDDTAPRRSTVRQVERSVHVKVPGSTQVLIAGDRPMACNERSHRCAGGSELRHRRCTSPSGGDRAAGSVDAISAGGGAGGRVDEVGDGAGLGDSDGVGGVDLDRR